MKKKIKLTEADLQKIVDNTVKMINEGWHANLGEYYHPDNIVDIIDYYDGCGYDVDDVQSDIIEILENLPEEEKAPYIDEIYDYYEGHDEHMERPQTFKEAMKEFYISPSELFNHFGFGGLVNTIYQSLIDDYGYERFANE